MLSTLGTRSLWQRTLQWADRQEATRTPVFSVLHTITRLVLITATEFSKNKLSLRAGALTFTIILSLVPMLAMSTAIVKGLGGGDQLRKAAYTYISTLDQSSTAGSGATDGPEQHVSSRPAKTSLSGHLRTAIDQLFDYVDNTNFTTLGTVGVVGIFFSILLVLNHIEAAMNEIWQVASGRSVLRKVADYLTLLILFPLSINVAFAARAFLENPALASRLNVIIPATWLQKLLLKPLPFLFITLSFYALYMFFTSTKVKTVPAVIGATAAALLWFTIQDIYINLQIGVAKYNAIYGSFATLPLFLVWLYLGWVVVLSGAQFAFSCQKVASYKLLPELAPQPSQVLGAAFDIMESVYASFRSQKRLTKKTLVKTMAANYPVDLLEDVIEKLLRANSFKCYPEDDVILPTIPQEHYTDETLIGIILGNQAPATSGGTKSLQVLEAMRKQTSCSSS